MKHIVPLALTGLIAVILANPSRADDLLFKNGDRWTGKLISLSDGKVKFKTELVGALTVDAKKVLTIETDDDVEVHMNDGTVLVDTLDSADAGTTRTKGNATPGSVLLMLDDMASINPPEPEWTGRALVGGEIERGNTIKDSAYVELNAKYETKANRIGLRGSYDGERTKNRSDGTSTTQDRNLFGRLRYDYFLKDRYFWYLQTSGEKDGPSDLDLRFVVGTGLGRDFVKRPDLKLSAYAGPTFISENFNDESSDDQRAAGRVGWDFWWKAYGDIALFTEGTYTQAGLDDILVEGEVGFRDELTESIFLEGKIVWEYDSEPAEDADRQDVDYIFGLGYKF